MPFQNLIPLIPIVIGLAIYAAGHIYFGRGQ